MRELGSWMVFYTDGTSLTQFDESSPLFIGEPGTGEVPYRAIEWPRVEKLRLESQWNQSDFDIIPPPEGYQISLRSRVFHSGNGSVTSVFMIVVSDAAVEVDRDSARHVTYWFPNGVIHDCPRFNCPDVANYGSGLIHGHNRGLMPSSHEVDLEAAALLTESQTEAIMEAAEQVIDTGIQP